MIERGERAHVDPGERVTVTTRSGTRRPSYVRPMEEERGRAPERVVEREPVRWAPIVAGTLVALGLLFLLSLLGLAIGLASLQTNGAANGNVPSQAGPASAGWGIVSAIISFVVGGYVASRFGDVITRATGGLHGALVFFLAVPLLLWLALQGAGGLLGGIGGYLGNYRPVGAAPNTNDIAAAAEAARNGAIGALLGSLIALASSIVGGMSGARQPVIDEDWR
jgi:hypothetical protein